MSGMSPCRRFELTTLRAQYHYITTVAYMYIPRVAVALLKVAVGRLDQLSYESPDACIKTILSLINPAIPIEQEDLSTSAYATSPPPAPSPSLTATSSSSGLKSGSKIGIGIATPLVVVVLLLFAILFWRKRKATYHKARDIDFGEGKDDNERNSLDKPDHKKLSVKNSLWPTAAITVELDAVFSELLLSNTYGRCTGK